MYKENSISETKINIVEHFPSSAKLNFKNLIFLIPHQNIFLILTSYNVFMFSLNRFKSI